jgi:hypothetical protein
MKETVVLMTMPFFILQVMIGEINNNGGRPNEGKHTNNNRKK